MVYIWDKKKQQKNIYKSDVIDEKTDGDLLSFSMSLRFPPFCKLWP